MCGVGELCLQQAIRGRPSCPRHEITGAVLLKLTEWDLEDMGTRPEACGESLCCARAPSYSATRQRVVPTDRHSFVVCQ